MKKDTKWAVAIAVAVGLMGGVPVAKAGMAEIAAGSALVDAIAGEGVAGAWEPPGWDDYADFDRAADHHPRRPDILAFANLKTEAGDNGDGIGERNRRVEFKIIERMAASNGAFLDGPAGADLGRTTFYEGGLPTGGPSLWACNIDAFKALGSLVSILSKEQGFDFVSFLKENGFEDDPKAARNYGLYLALSTPKNQQLVASMATEKITVEDLAKKLAAQIPPDADFKAEVPEVGIKVSKPLVEVYKGIEMEGKPVVEIFNSKEECCGGEKAAEEIKDEIKHRKT